MAAAPATSGPFFSPEKEGKSMNPKIPIKMLVFMTAYLLVLGLGGCAGKQDQAVRNLTDDEFRTLRQKQEAGRQMPAPDPSLATAPAKEVKGDQLVRKGQATAALFEYHRALAKAKPDQAKRLRLKIGQIYLRMKQYMQAESQFKEVLKADQDCALAWQGQGLTLLSQGKLSHARDCFIKAITLDPGLWKSLNALGVIHNRTGHPDLALEVFDRALVIQPGSAALYNNKGLSLMLMKKYDQAEMQFKRALSLDPGHKLALNNLGLLSAKQGKWAEAQRYFEMGLGKAKAHHNLGVLMADQGMSAEAAEQFRRAMENSPRHYDRASEGLKQLEATTPRPELLTPKNRYRHFEIDIQRKPYQEEISKPRPQAVKQQKSSRVGPKIPTKKQERTVILFPKQKATLLSPFEAPPRRKEIRHDLTIIIGAEKPANAPKKTTYKARVKAGAEASAKLVIKPKFAEKTVQKAEPKVRGYVRRPMPKFNLKEASLEEPKTIKRRGFVRRPMPTMPIILTQKAPQVLPVDIPEPEERLVKVNKAQKVFYIQVASLRSEDRAERLGEQISRYTKKVKLENWESTKQVKWQRVLLGPFAAKNDALKQARKLENTGLVSGHMVFSRWQGKLI